LRRSHLVGISARRVSPAACTQVGPQDVHATILHQAPCASATDPWRRGLFLCCRVHPLRHGHAMPLFFLQHNRNIPLFHHCRGIIVTASSQEPPCGLKKLFYFFRLLPACRCRDYESRYSVSRSGLDPCIYLFCIMQRAHRERTQGSSMPGACCIGLSTYPRLAHFHNVFLDQGATLFELY
jgi:hypothetical protein